MCFDFRIPWFRRCHTGNPNPEQERPVDPSPDSYQESSWIHRLDKVMPTDPTDEFLNRYTPAIARWWALGYWTGLVALVFVINVVVVPKLANNVAASKKALSEPVAMFLSFAYGSAGLWYLVLAVWLLGVCVILKIPSPKMRKFRTYFGVWLALTAGVYLLLFVATLITLMETI